MMLPVRRPRRVILLCQSAWPVEDKDRWATSAHECGLGTAPVPGSLTVPEAGWGGTGGQGGLSEGAGP